MTNYMEEAFAPVEAKYRDEVLSATWGHLYPEEGRKYHGYIYFIHSIYGDLTVIDDDFEGLSGPWYFDDLMNFVSEKASKLEEGGVYKFVGTYVRFKNQNHRFSGKIKKVVLE